MVKVQKLLVCAIGFVLTVPVLHAVQRVEQWVYPVQPGSTLKVDTYRGLINVLPEGVDEVKVTVGMSIDTDRINEAREVMEGFELKATTVEKELQLVARNPRDSNVRFEWTKQPRPTVEITIHVPKNMHLNLTTSDGNLTVGNLDGSVRARADMGTIFLRRIEGDVDARTNFGDVIVSRCMGKVDLRSMQGSIRVGTVGGRATLETVSGDIEIMSAYAEVMAETEEGNVSAGFAQVPAASKIRTAVGNIFARVNPDQAFSLQASSTWGRVISKFTSNGATGERSSRSRLADQHNGGGPLIKLKASGGNVTIEPGEPLFEL